MIEDLKVNESDLDKLVLLEEETIVPKSFENAKSFHYTLTKNDVPISIYEVWIGGIGEEAVVSYLNCFYDSEDEEMKKQYVGKGYTTRGLIMVCDKIFKDNLAPFVRLDIGSHNLASKEISEKVGFTEVAETHYELLNPKAEEMLNKLIKEHLYKPSTSVRLLQQLEYVKMRKQQKTTEK